MDNEISKILMVVLILMIMLLAVFSVILLVLQMKAHKRNNGIKKRPQVKEEKGKGKKGENDKQVNTSYTKKSIFDFMEFNGVEDNMIVQKDGKRYIMVIECQGVNYDLMSQMEKVGVEEGFQQFLNTLRFPIQIYIQTRTINLEKIIQGYKDKLK